MSVITIHPLLDGSPCLDTVRAQRVAKVAEMASRLVETGAFVDHGDSVMVLASFGYSLFEVHALVADARQVAAEHVVAMEMCEP
ncbi:hypothetical protein MA20_32115 [Bradyrhizobium japonicum]|uniref:Uncharacterized protein n=1 Tax=Bradyrhizobium japonicum TaxID=375 RepID=A0A0A3XN70_BRAJP|nr:hypothetical protein [Bradyrhizobium japonicum]KGT75835.1 hypothetical protein MA20_32115 [Bradyrhizobium japonicum]